MTEKRFYLNEEKVNILKILDLKEDNETIYHTALKSDMKMVVKLLNELHEENEQLKQFQEKVASVIESKMGDNVCNDYKMQVLKEVWNELNLDEVWFE